MRRLRTGSAACSFCGSHRPCSPRSRGTDGKTATSMEVAADTANNALYDPNLKK